MIKQNTIDAVRDLAIKDVVGRYIDLKKKGANYVVASPFTEEKTPSFTVFPKKNNWKCFSSGKQGDGIAFVMEYKHYDNWFDAIREIASDHRIPIEEEDLTPEQKEKRQQEFDEKKEVLNVMEYAKNHFITNEIPEDWKKDRKYKDDLLTTFHVGYGSGTTTLVDDALKAGYKTDLLKKARLMHNVLDPASPVQKVWVQVDAYADRVTFPILDVKGHCIAFSGRTTKEVSSDNPKYFNSPSAIWEKSRNLYGLYQAQDSIRKADKAFLVEGNTDVITMHRWGLDNTVSSCGTSLTSEQCKLLHRYTENVCIVPDNDVEKADNPGMKALERNALLLLKHGFFVSVLIPGDKNQKTNVDPDSFLRKKQRKEQVTKWLQNEERYIEDYLVTVCMSKAALGAKQKGEAFKSMADVIESIHDYTFRSAYYDSVCNDWPYFKKHKLQKRESEAETTDIQKLLKDQRDSLFNDDFFEENGAYWTFEKKSTKQISNFTYEAIFCVFHQGSDNKQDLKYVLKLKSQHGRIRLLVISSDDFCGAMTFKRQTARKHGFDWYGNEINLDKVKGVNNRGIPEAKELERVGWNVANKFWVWSNGLYYNNSFHKIDEFGISVHAKKITTLDQLKAIPPESQVKIESTIYVLNTAAEFIKTHGESSLENYMERGAIYHMKFFYLPYGKSLKLSGGDDSGNPFKENSKYIVAKKEDQWTFEKWCDIITKVYPQNSELIIAYYLSTLFSDLIYNFNFGYFPLLFMFGKRQSGKSTAARSIMWMFGKPPMEDGINLASGSTSTGMQRSMDSSTNLPFWGNEYKNSIHKNTIEALKGIADRSGKLTGVKTSGNETKIIKPRGSGIISGQDLPTQDPALLSRCLIQEYDDTKRGDAEALKLLKEAELTGAFTHITCELLQYREYIKEYPKIEPQISTELLEVARKHYGEVYSRSILNMASVLTVIKILMDNTKLKFPFTYEQARQACLESVKLTVSIQSQSDEVEQYFHVLQSLCNLHKIQDEVHFKIKIDTDCTKLYLRAGNIHGLYKQQARAEGITALDQAVLGQYLRKHRTFIEYAGKNLTIGNNRTSGYIFNYDKLQEQGIELHTFSTTDNGFNNAAFNQPDMNYILSKIISKKEDDTILYSQDLKRQIMKEANRSMTDDEFIELINHFNMADKNKEIKGNDNNMKEIYVKSKLPF